jgi:arginine decarboxylase
MTIPVIGWEQSGPVPDGYRFNEYLQARQGRLYYEDLDLAQLLLGGRTDQGLGRILANPLEIVYLPRIRANIAALQRAFAAAIDALDYPGRFLYAFPSKANAAEEVISTVLGSGVHFEMSTAVDVEIAEYVHANGRLGAGQMVLCNGVKLPGMAYTENILRLRRQGLQVVPILEDPAELPAFAGSGLTFDLGLRQKSYGHQRSLAEMDSGNSRFGMTSADLMRVAAQVEAAPGLRLVMYHAMVGSQITDPADFVARLTPPMEIYARLRQSHPHLRIFNFGGGLPGAMTLDLRFSYEEFARRLLGGLLQVCQRLAVPPPDVLGEVGRYTVTEHGAHLFKVLLAKQNGSQLPWYIVNGSLMTSFPDTWALAEHFIVLPLNHLDKPFRRVQLGGITCDSDDLYPPKSSAAPLYLPVETRDLHIGFFGIGAYQEILGGAGGAKHCVIPEANELIVERDEPLSGQPPPPYRFRVIPGQRPGAVLRNLGYQFHPQPAG